MKHVLTDEGTGVSCSFNDHFLSSAVEHPIKLKSDYPDTVVVTLPSEEIKERARRYYGLILEEMFNETKGVYIGC